MSVYICIQHCMSWRTKSEPSYGAEETPSPAMLRMTHSGTGVPDGAGLLTSEFRETVEAFAKDSSLGGDQGLLFGPATMPY